MKRILYLIPTLDRSGSEKQLTLLASGLPRNEFEPEVCTLTRSGPYQKDLEDAGIKVSSINKRARLDPAALWRLRRHLKKGSYDILHTWLFAANSYGRLAGSQLAPVTVVSERCADHWKGSVEHRVDKWLESRADMFIGNSQAVADYYEERGINRSRFRVIPNGIELTPQPNVDRDEVLREFDIPSGAYVLGFVGRLWPQKRTHDLIWATEIVHRSHNSVALIVGDGPDRGKLEEYTEKINLTGHVRFAGSRTDITRLMAAMDVFVLPSEFEGMPNVVLEAMWAGLPVVATDIPGTNELIQNEETGILVPVGSTRDLTQNLNRLLGDSELRRSLGTAAKQHVAEHFGVDRMVNAHVELYRELLQ